MVLDKGFVVEFDTPINLLAQKGIFYSMAQEAGIAWIFWRQREAFRLLRNNDTKHIFFFKRLSNSSFRFLVTRPTDKRFRWLVSVNFAEIGLGQSLRASHIIIKLL